MKTAGKNVKPHTTWKHVKHLCW